jgi:hypothetical protein
VLLSIVARVACATVLLAAGISAGSAGPLDETMDTSFVVVAVMGGHDPSASDQRVTEA